MSFRFSRNDLERMEAPPSWHSWWLKNPSTADNLVPVIKHGRLPRRYRALRLIKGCEHFGSCYGLECGPSRLVTMANLRPDSHRDSQLRNADPDQPVCTQGFRCELGIGTHRHSMVRRIDIQHVERRRGGHLQSLVLPNGEAGNALVLPQHLAS